jgi:hypothetical protein
MKTIQTISRDEKLLLGVLEKTIQAGVETFVTVGLALGEIQSARLYRAEFDTFEDYCEKRWCFTKGRAYQLIEAAATVRALPEHLSTAVDTERAARALKKVRSRGTKTPESRRVDREMEKLAKEGKSIREKDINRAANGSPEPEPRARGGLNAEAIAARNRKPAATPKEKLLDAFDRWWEKTKETMSYATPKPAVMVAEIRALIEGTL